MQLTTYQQRALEQVGRWFTALNEALPEQEERREFCEKKNKPFPSGLPNFPHHAWERLREKGSLPAGQGHEYIPRTGPSGEPIPHACLRVPTGGGKTLLGVATLEIGRASCRERV